VILGFWDSGIPASLVAGRGLGRKAKLEEGGNGGDNGEGGK
jgi:hypothetical protein